MERYIPQYLNLITGRIFGGRQSSDHFKEVTQELANKITKTRIEKMSSLKPLGLSLFKGQTVNVLGNGPSLGMFIPNEGVSLGVNASHTHCKPDLLLLIDCVHDDRPLNQFIRFKLLEGVPCVMTLTTWVNLVYHIPEFAEYVPLALFDARPTIDDDVNNGLYLRKSSVHAAFHLALMSKCSDIRIYGVDYSDRSHYYAGKIIGDPKDQPDQKWSDIETHLSGWRELAKEAAKRRIPVSVVNPESLLVKAKIFPSFKDAGLEVQVRDMNELPVDIAAEDTFRVMTYPQPKIEEPKKKEPQEDYLKYADWEKYVSKIHIGLKYIVPEET